MRIRRKMLAGYGVAFALLGVVLLWAIANLVSLGRATDAILRENYRSILAAEQMLQTLARQDKLVRDSAMGLDAEALPAFRKEEAAFFESLAKAKDNITIHEEGGVLETVETEYLAFLGAANGVLMRGTVSGPNPLADYQRAVLPGVDRAADACRALKSLNEDHMFSASMNAGRVASRAIWSTLAVGLVAMVLGIGFSLGFSRRLVHPISELTRATRRLAEGDYDVRVPAGGADELGALAQGFGAMAQKLGEYHKMNLRRLLSEQRQTDAVLKSISDGIIVLDADFHITRVNPAAANLFRCEAGEPASPHLLEVVRDQKVFDYVKRQAESGPSAGLNEEDRVLALEREGNVRYYLYDARPVQSEDKATAGTVLVFRDITRLQELDRMKSEFVMAASHELRTPMTGLEMSLGLLEERVGETLAAEQSALLETARQDVARLKALINDLLDLSRLESGTIDLQLVRVPLKSIAGKTVSLFDAQARERGIHLSCDIPEEVAEVKADPNKIAWVLSNLVSNALRYVDAGGHITVSAEQAGDWVHVHVADDGKGIPEEYHARVFDKFIQVEGAAGAGGTGLGLAISREIVRAHRGAIWVDSSVGRGSTFTFTLPVFTMKTGDTA